MTPDATAALAAIRARHVRVLPADKHGRGIPDAAFDVCGHDDDIWPCDTTVLLDRITNEPPLTPERHPGEPHEFRCTCLRCGEPGMLHVAFITPGEEVKIIAALASKEPTDD